jgi:hypothetical protein
MEIAIVMVVVSLLIGGILRGQELITSARVRNLADQASSIKASHYGFLNRFGLQAGDLTAAQALLVGPLTSPAFSNPANGVIEWQDSPTFFNNLTQAGFLICAQCSIMLTAIATEISTTNSPTNIFGTPIWVESATGGNSNTGTMFLTRLGIPENSQPKASTGNKLDTNILAQLDLKADDGNPATGQFRYSDWNWVASTGMASCVINPALPGLASWLVDDPGQCQGVTLF